jgi:thioredoxin reductase
MPQRYEVIIIGGGLAGLSAALMLGRCGRSVLIVDANDPRNGASRALHGYLTRDGVSPWTLRKLGLRDALRYPSVKFLRADAQSVRRDKRGFQIVLPHGETVRARLLLLATGRHDPPPDLPGFSRLFGRGVFHCPYCDAWEHRDRPVGVFGGTKDSLELAKTLLTWNRSITLFTQGRPQWTKANGAGRRLRIMTTEIAELEGRRRLKRVILVDGTKVACDALFFPTPCPQKSDIPEQLGCRFDAEGSVQCVGHCARGVDDVFIAGNVRGGVHLAITAAAEGAEAAILINDRLAQ